MKWILGFFGAFIIFLFGNAIILIINQFLFDYTPYWIASVLGTVIALFGAYKTVDISFYKFPYPIMGNRTISLYQVLNWLLVLACVVALINHEQFENLSSMPKWLYISIRPIKYIFLIK